ncbi:MAG TPA: Gfo/Idh/MocA family oxidoreductase [Tepidisphaeraceae bacterium]|jgi:predicted dehydrogenase
MDLNYQPRLPNKPRPIAIVGAGGIVNDAHLPAYQMAGFPVFGIIDLERSKSDATARRFGIQRVFDTLEQMVDAAPADCIYDIALPASEFAQVLQKLPNGSAALIQKPMGDSLEQAIQIRDLCRRKKLTAAVNFQLRHAPFVAAARDIIQRGTIGDIYDMEVRVCVQMPWDLFPSVKMHPRLEICYHSIHYIDLIRSFLGEPNGVYAKTVAHPAKPLSSTRTIIILDYGPSTRAGINTNHDHDFGPHAQDSFIKWEGTKGAIKAKMGLLMNYPNGVPDLFEYCLLTKDQPPKWASQKLEGSWFPHGFVGTMASIQRYVEGSDTTLATSVEDAIKTMAVVEAAYESSAKGATPIRRV